MTSETMPAFRRSADTAMLVQRLQGATIGETITYEDLSKVISSPVVGGTRSLQSAKRILLHESRMVFEVVTRIGVKRLNDVDIVDTSFGTTKKIRRLARRGIRKLGAVEDFSAMPQASQMRHTAITSTLAVVAEFSTEKTVAKITVEVGNATDKLSIAQTIEAFRK